jgi:hypothetical protein
VVCLAGCGLQVSLRKCRMQQRFGIFGAGLCCMGCLEYSAAGKRCSHSVGCN